MSTTHQHKPATAAISLQQAIETAAQKYEATIANPTSPRQKSYARRALAGLEKFRSTERAPLSQ